MNKEQWIREVFESTNGRERPGISPFFTEKVLARISAGDIQRQSVPAFRWAAAMAAAIIITVNVMAFGRLVHERKEGKNIAIRQAMDINNEVIYTY